MTVLACLLFTVYILACLLQHPLSNSAGMFIAVSVPGLVYCLQHMVLGSLLCTVYCSLSWRVYCCTPSKQKKVATDYLP